jgi:hypothetical protein
VDRWLDQLAETLGVDPLGGAETGELLRASRDVAHGVERRYAPLASFLLGAATERRVAAGASRDEAFRGAVERLRSVLPETGDEEPGAGEGFSPVGPRAG